jgi:hypothetical protein
MPRAHVLLFPSSLLLSCAPAALDSGVATLSAVEPVPAEASASWLEGVRLRIAAHARSIVPEGEGFTAALPANSAVARFTEMGLVLGELDAGYPLRLRFSS